MIVLLQHQEIWNTNCKSKLIEIQQQQGTFDQIQEITLLG